LALINTDAWARRFRQTVEEMSLAGGPRRLKATAGRALMNLVRKRIGIDTNRQNEYAWEMGLMRPLAKSTLQAGALALALASAATTAEAQAVYQWSVPVSGVVSRETNAPPQAFLWVPPACRTVRAVVLGQHNLLEEPLFEAPVFRRALSKACIGEVWVTPMFDMVFDFQAGAGDQVSGLMNALAKESGYPELATAPVAPVGHSAAASFPWNFAAWAPERTLAVVSLKGDAPLTPLTGSGKPNPDWGARTIEGVPALMVMGEYEWREDRLAPALAYQKAHPKAPISLYADAGRGHFDVSDQLADYVGRFIGKAADARLPLSGTTPLRPVDPDAGWRADRWRADQPPAAPAAKAVDYAGPRDQSFWYFDADMARRAADHYRRSRGKAPQLLGFVQKAGVVAPKAGHAQIELAFEPQADGVTFTLHGSFLDHVPDGSPQPPQWTGLPVGAPLGHADGPIAIVKETGPVKRMGPDTWTLAFDRAGFDNRKRGGDVWFVAIQPGDKRHKSAVQQAILRVPLANTTGQDQAITFDLPPGVSRRETHAAVPLTATSDQGLPVRYYVKRGPAEIDGNTLRFTPIPRSAQRPIKVTVVAWQFGVAGRIKSATPVERTLLLVD
jgi:hypothetical protein